MLAVELNQLEGHAGRRAGTGNHVGRFTGDIQKAAAVVAYVQHQIGDTGRLQRGERGQQLRLGGRQLIVEQHVPTGPLAVARVENLSTDRAATSAETMVILRTVPFRSRIWNV